MSETDSTPTLFSEALCAELRMIIKRAVQEAVNGHKTEDPLLTAEKLAKRLNVPVSWIYEQSRQGNIPTHRLGRYIRFDLHEVLDSQKKS